MSEYMRKPPFLLTRLMNVNEIGMDEMFTISHKSVCCSIDVSECSPKWVPLMI